MNDDRRAVNLYVWQDIADATYALVRGAPLSVSVCTSGRTLRMRPTAPVRGAPLSV